MLIVGKTLCWLLAQVLSFVVIVVPLLIAVAFFTLAERKIMAAMQRRSGPHIVGYWGLLQPFADGVKLLTKQTIVPNKAQRTLFMFAPVYTFALALSAWVVIPYDVDAVVADISLGVVYLLAISTLSVYGIIIAGWASNSKYAFLGALRAAAQMISYDVSLGLILLSIGVCVGSFNLTEIVLAQEYRWFIVPFFPLALMFFISSLAETNRAPFDLTEAEAELVAGYNVEYSAVGFVLFFLAEYANMLLMSLYFVILFLGGWYPPFEWLAFIPNKVWLAIKTVLIVFLFIWVRASLPRFRYDQLMTLGWKVFLPWALVFFVLVSSFFLVTRFTATFNMESVTEKSVKIPQDVVSHSNNTSISLPVEQPANYDILVKYFNLNTEMFGLADPMGTFTTLLLCSSFIGVLFLIIKIINTAVFQKYKNIFEYQMYKIYPSIKNFLFILFVVFCLFNVIICFYYDCFIVYCSNEPKDFNLGGFIDHRNSTIASSSSDSSSSSAIANTTSSSARAAASASSSSTTTAVAFNRSIPGASISLSGSMQQTDTSISLSGAVSAHADIEAVGQHFARILSERPKAIDMDDFEATSLSNEPFTIADLQQSNPHADLQKRVTYPAHWEIGKSVERHFVRLEALQAYKEIHGHQMSTAERRVLDTNLDAEFCKAKSPFSNFKKL